eukprot:SAG31_NODE_34184_length_335_cov_1.508475_1_plen_45_part_01
MMVSEIVIVVCWLYMILHPGSPRFEYWRLDVEPGEIQHNLEHPFP